MALFTVNRYLGEDEEEEEEKLETVNALAKLKAEALKRKAERESKEEKKTKKIKKESKKTEKETNALSVEKQFTSGKPDPEVAEKAASELNAASAEAQVEELPVANDSVPQKGNEIPGELGGFTILTAVERKEKAAVDRVLPEWLSKPSIIAVDLREDASPIADDLSIDDRLKSSLSLNGIREFFPVQRHVIPFLLSSLRDGTLYQNPGFLRPNDICVSAPTGSGKTLAFAVPILQALRHRVVTQIRALVVLPVKDLALQVYKVFATHAAALGIKVGLAVSGHNQSLIKERECLVGKSHVSGGFYSKVDILVATPGRLVDHLQTTPGFSLRHLRFLVIDEADRMMEDVKQDWLEMVEDSALKGTRFREADPRRSLCLGGLDEPLRPVYPLQKLLFSATLSQNPEKLESLKLFQPKLFTSVVKRDGEEDARDDGEDHSLSTATLKAGQFVGKYTTPTALTEYTCFVRNPSLKPLIVLYFISHLKFKRVLVFTNTKENARRLLHLTRGFDGGGISAREFSSNLTSEKRERILKQFDQEKVDMIICTDAMARGMDVAGVKWVISYDCPIYVKVSLINAAAPPFF